MRPHKIYIVLSLCFSRHLRHFILSIWSAWRWQAVLSRYPVLC